MNRSGWNATRVTRAVLTAMASFALFCDGFAVSAQTMGGSGLDAGILEKLQQQLGASAPARSTTLDTARENGDQQNATQTGADNILNRNQLTNEEVELNSQVARQKLDEMYTPSAIEREYRTRLEDDTLRQFGYELFKAASTASGPLTGQVNDHYIVGVGDDLVVNFQGATNESNVVRVNREGQVIVGALPPIQAAGRSLGQVRGEIELATRSTLLGTNVFVSVGSVRAITVFVGGEVNRPGQYQLTSLSDVATALARSGGVRRTGSLRRIRVVRGNRTISLDLYGLLGIGTPNSVRLQDGDRVIVPVIGDTVAVMGSVARPGIYELRGGGATVGAILDYAGGAVRPRGSSVSISRINSGGGEAFVRVSGVNQQIVAGDALVVTAGSAGGAVNRVSLQGNVINPGPRPLPAAPTVRDLLGTINDVKPDTYLPMAALIRRDPQSGSRVFQPVNLVSALGSGPSVPLQANDTLWVFSRADIAFMNRAAVRQIVLGQPNPIPQCQSLARLADTVRDTQSSRFSVLTRGAFIVEREGKSEAANVGSSTAVNVGGSTVTNAVQEASLNAAQMSKDTAAAACAPTFEREPALLPFLIENSIGIGGGVRRPGAYPVAGTITASVALSIAEGATTGNEGVVIDVTASPASGSPTLQRYALDADGKVLTRIAINPGDDLRLSTPQPQFESASVLLTGEFVRPGLYTIRKGETLSSLFERAGGLTNFAYPYGAVMTRRSVRQAEEEGFRRTSRDLGNAVLSIAARKNVNADGLAAVSQISKQLASAEGAGRVVVEADPRVLAARPNLDTILEGGDAIYMPKQPNFVIVLGDISNPGAVQYREGRRVAQYVSDAGGTQFSADKGRIYVVYPNGLAQPVKSSVWRSSNVPVPPGTTVIVPKNLDPLFKLDLVSNIISIVGSLVSSVATVAIIAQHN